MALDERFFIPPKSQTTCSWRWVDPSEWIDLVDDGRLFFPNFLLNNQEPRLVGLVVGLPDQMGNKDIKGGYPHPGWDVGREVRHVGWRVQRGVSVGTPRAARIAHLVPDYLIHPILSILKGKFRLNKNGKNW